MFKKIAKIISASILAILMSAVSAAAATFYVPDDFTAIQPALDACLNGDTVILRDGTYKGALNRNLDFKGKALTLRSENGKESCIIDCEGGGRAFYFHSQEIYDSVLEGVTIVNGSVSMMACGGAINCTDSSPTIIDCKISGNYAGKGGGIFCGNYASPAIIGCVIEGNEAYYYGGGISLWFYASPEIEGCDISGNTAGNGGGIHGVYSSCPDIVNCTIEGNLAKNTGGGIECIVESSPTILNCTLTNNIALSGGGTSFGHSSYPIMSNSILWDNSGESGGPQIAVQYTSGLALSHSDVQGGAALVLVGGGSTLEWQEGNIDADPVFAGAGDYHLTAQSPCVDTGTDSGLYADIDGDMRPQGIAYDIGSDEVSAIEDLDGDGYGSDVDCDDADASIYPGAPELCDGIDNDCDDTIPVDETDGDGDGYSPCEGDCDDADAGVNPGALEIPGNDVDENCDGSRGTCDPGASWKNHGQYVRCVAQEVRALIRNGVISKAEGKAMVVEAAKSDVGKKRKE